MCRFIACGQPAVHAIAVDTTTMHVIVGLQRSLVGPKLQSSLIRALPL
jgi:hypothetical protein